MKSIKRAATALCLVAIAAFPLSARADEAPSLGALEAVHIATEAYIYGYPLVTFDTVRRQQTNADTLYTETWLDVSREPWILSIPDMDDRYYIVPMLDGWSEVFMVASSPTTGGSAQTYAITGPGWSGALPQGVTQVNRGAIN
jgi:hypothetical protein